MGIFSYMFENIDQIMRLLLEHIQLTAIAVGLAILVGLPLGILISYVKPLNKPVMGATNLIQAVPSMALLGFAIVFPLADCQKYLYRHQSDFAGHH